MQHSPLSAIHPNAKIGANVTISPFVSIDDDVEIGEGTWIAPNVTIFAGARIGKHCRIFPGAVLSATPQDLKFGGEPTTLEIGDYTQVRECATLNRGTSATGTTRIGGHCLIMAYVHVAHDCTVGDGCILANNATLAGHVDLEENVILGGFVAIQQFTRVGAYSMLGGGTLHNKDVPPFIRVARQPASYIGVNSIGLRRRGFLEQEIREIQDMYHLLFVAKVNRSEALQRIEQEFGESKHQKRILDFVRGSKQGILKGLQP